ncbi:MAG: CarD family transcriptional regulator, partial [Clostridia bacterium]
MSAEALLQLYPKRKLVEDCTFSLAVEDIISPLDAAKRLANCGYTRQDMIGEIGDFALRGDILDVYSLSGAAFRINFFDELVESIKTIDPMSMLSLNTKQEVSFPPVGDIILDAETSETATKKLQKYAENKYASELICEIHEGVLDPSAIWGLPFMNDATSSIFEYFDDGKPTVFIFDEPKVVFDKLQILDKEFNGRIKTLLDGGEILPEHKASQLAILDIKRLLLTRRQLSFSSMNLSNPLFESKMIIEPKTRPVVKYYLDPISIFADLRNFQLSGFKVVIAAGSIERAKGIIASLFDENIFAAVSYDGEGDEGVLVTPLSIENGFIYPDMKVALIGVSECVGKHRGQDTIAQKQQFTAPKAGDYVVHRVHGVGLCEGTEIRKVGEFEKEYIVLKYRDGDTLYVASDQMDNLQKFVGEENPRLNKLGGREFEREKEKVKKSVRKLAINLLDLYAKRQKQKGFKYAEDTVWQHEFEDNFEYDETADQLKAIEAIKEDMESGKIMDRLIVGDVGFGKTEVAFRAMFKTVLDNKQAVLLAPTTILARQHYENLIARLKPFGISCGFLSRLQTAAENKETISQLEDGTMHMVVATHKVLSKDVGFRDLGLLVLDEEQRFGVEHKEKLKDRYPLVNVLTLSATPIPRTLNMALSGVRDISMLETAPEGRLPVQTYVVGYSDALAVDAIEREAARGGQTLILLNDISQLDKFAARLRTRLASIIRVITAHVQMASGELEDRIADFYDNKYDVLIATTIIENGIDLPDANTLIVINADHFGLSQLYQLRGRVGRRGVLAHAYFTLPENGALSTTAEKRLKALLDNTELGSGFKIALSDLSIRGAGNLLGA